jgi:LuxR family transcriptional regulator, maltose regulon positive regulatory protein
MSSHVATLLRHWDPAVADAGVRELIELDDEATALPDTFVRRRALVDQLTAGPAVTLVVIVAPSGYGKSSLLAEWAQADERRFVWLVPARAERFGERRSGLEAVAAAQDAEGAGCVFALDDAHRLDPAVLRRLVCEVLPGLHAGSTLVLAARRELELPLALLRAHRAVVELRAHDLALAEPEARQLLERAGLDIGPEETRSLLDRTEGWPAALYLAALSMSPGNPAPEGATLTQYISDEVLAGVPKRLLSVARRSSVLEELTPGACDAILMRRGGARDLEALSRDLPLLRAQDDERTRYRWHPVIRQALQRELRVREPELEHDLQQRASDWYLAHGDTDRAIEHACAAGDQDRAGALLWPMIPAYVAGGRRKRTQNWLALLREEQIAGSAELAASAAHCALAGGELDAARRWSLHATAAMELEHDGARAPGLSAGLTAIEAAGATAGVARMQVSADQACRSEPADSLWRPWCRAVSGVAAYLAGKLDAADEILDDAVALASDAVPAVTALCLSQRAMIGIHREEWELAADHAHRALEVIHAHALSDDLVAGFVLAATAATAAHEGRSDIAKRDVRASLDLMVTAGDSIAWLGAEVRIPLACARLSLADVVGARTLLAQASRLARRTRGASVFEHWFNTAWSHMDTIAEATLAGPSALTIAELRILRFLPSHLSFREIAGRLGVSPNTVKTQAHGVYRKLRAASRSEAVLRAQEAGLLSS